MERMEAKTRLSVEWLLMPLKTHCKRGHLLSDDNVYAYVAQSGRQRGRTVRQCRKCTRGKNERRASQLRASHLQRKFGITLAEYDEMLRSQNGKCAVCGTDEPGGMGSFHVDHCHKSGKIRKLLCMICNSALGYVNDDPVLLEKLAAYVREHSESQ